MSATIALGQDNDHPLASLIVSLVSSFTWPWLVVGGSQEYPGAT